MFHTSKVVPTSYLVSFILQVDKQDNLLEMIQDYTDTQASRHNLIRGLHDWFFQLDDLNELTVSEAELTVGVHFP